MCCTKLRQPQAPVPFPHSGTCAAAQAAFLCAGLPGLSERVLFIYSFGGGFSSSRGLWQVPFV